MVNLVNFILYSGMAKPKESKKGPKQTSLVPTAKDLPVLRACLEDAHDANVGYNSDFAIVEVVSKDARTRDENHEFLKKAKRIVEGMAKVKERKKVKKTTIIIDACFARGC